MRCASAPGVHTERGRERQARLSPGESALGLHTTDRTCFGGTLEGAAHRARGGAWSEGGVATILREDQASWSGLSYAAARSVPGLPPLLREWWRPDHVISPEAGTRQVARSAGFWQKQTATALWRGLWPRRWGPSAGPRPRPAGLKPRWGSPRHPPETLADAPCLLFPLLGLSSRG